MKGMENQAAEGLKLDALKVREFEDKVKREMAKVEKALIMPSKDGGMTAEVKLIEIGTPGATPSNKSAEQIRYTESYKKLNEAIHAN